MLGWVPMRGSAASPGAVLLIAAIGALAFAGTSAGGEATSAGAAGEAQGRLAFSARFDESAGPYSAGATPFVVVRTAGGKVVAQRRAASGSATVSLPRGRYAVAAYWRPCEGSCDAEDLPLDRCTKRVSIHTASRGASETVSASAVFKGGEPCSLRLSSDWPPQAVISTAATSLNATRGPYCRPSPKTCTPLGFAAEHPAPPPDTRGQPREDRPQGADPQARVDRNLRQRTAESFEGGPALVVQGSARDRGGHRHLSRHQADDHVRRTRYTARRKGRVRVRPAPGRLRSLQAVPPEPWFAGPVSVAPSRSRSKRRSSSENAQRRHPLDSHAG